VFRSKLPLFILLVFSALSGAWLLSLDPHRHFTTDVTELLPVGERDPEARLALSLVKERQARVVLIALKSSSPQLASAAQSFAANLRASPAFDDAELLADQSWQHTLGKQLHARRLELLLPTWLAEQRRAYVAEKSTAPFPDWLAARATAALDAHLASPESAATAELLPSDPLLLLISLAEKASAITSTPGVSPGQALIWAETQASPLSEEGQDPVFAALNTAESAARAIAPDLSVHSTGVARFAAAAKASTRAEIGKLNMFALVAVLLISACFIRRLHGLLHLLPPVLISMLGAVAITTLVFPRVHVLVFALGSLLSGVAVDYGFHLVLARRENESYSARLRRLALPLLGGSGTTVAGFLVLTLSELPLVRQLGVYVAAGIVTGLGATLLYFALFPALDLAPRNLPVRNIVSTRWRLPVLALLVLVSVAGIMRVHWHDDLRTLEYPSPELRAEDAVVRSAFGETDAGSTFLTRGSSFAEARSRWQAFEESVPPGVRLASIAGLFPGPEDYAAAISTEGRKDLSVFVNIFGSKSEEAGFDKTELQPFFNDFAAYLAQPPPDYEVLMRETLAALPGPMGLLVHTDEDGVGFLSSTSQVFKVPIQTEGTLSLSGIEGLNTLFARYRAAATRLSLFGCLALVVVSCCLHGPRIGLRTASLPLLAAALSFGLLALSGEIFGLFHLLGALLGVCLADDYAHFSHSDDASGPEARTAIRLSALTTAASFSVLMLSAIPAVFALGSTVTLIVILALVFVETDLFSLRVHA
jgi:predicted exporter